jgi:hypothetical protein
VQVIASFLALMGAMVFKNRGRAKAFVLSFMAFEGYPQSFALDVARVHRNVFRVAGIIVLELCLEIWVWIGATAPLLRLYHFFGCMDGLLSQDIAGDAFFIIGMNKHADKAWVNDLLL